MDGPCCCCHEWTRNCELFVYADRCEDCTVTSWIRLGIVRLNAVDGNLDERSINPHRPWPPRLPRRVKACRYARDQ
jgi:hypothetical protein